MNIEQEIGILTWQDYEIIEVCKHILASTSGIHKIERSDSQENYYLVPESFYQEACNKIKSWRGLELWKRK